MGLYVSIVYGTVERGLHWTGLPPIPVYVSTSITSALLYKRLHGLTIIRIIYYYEQLMLYSLCIKVFNGKCIQISGWLFTSPHHEVEFFFEIEKADE